MNTQYDVHVGVCILPCHSIQCIAIVYITGKFRGE